MEFKVGDIVEAFGHRGVVKELYGSAKGLLMTVEYTPKIEERLGDYVVSTAFYHDGRLETWHKEPSVRLIERPKKKIKKTIHGFLNVFPTGTTVFWDNLKDAERYRGKAITVEVNQEYEIVVEG